MVPLGGRFGRGWLVAASVAFLAVVIFGAMSQGGFLAPRFRNNGGGVSGGSISNSLQNVSWRSWTITGIHLADKKSTLALRDVKVVRLSLYPGSGLPYGGASLRRLTVGPGQTFSVNLVERQSDCSPPPPIANESQMNRYLSSPANHEHDIPADITVATPLGTRTIGTTFTFSCSV
jgi:hypothetical protein